MKIIINDERVGKDDELIQFTRSEGNIEKEEHEDGKKEIVDHEHYIQEENVWSKGVEQIC